MAASVLNVLLRRLPNISPFRGAYGVQVPLQTLCTKAPLRMILCSQFLSPLMRMNPGSNWTQKNTRTAMVLALSGLTTVETTKVEYPHSGLERCVFMEIKLLGTPAPSAGIRSCMLTLGT